MNIDASRIKPHPGATMQVDERAEVQFDGNTAQVHLVGALQNIGTAMDNHLELRADLTAEVCTPCARCLEEVRLPYETQIVQQISNTAEEAADDTLLYEGNAVEFEPFIKGILRADMPMAVLCSEDCKGMCQVCGGNLNQKDCGCQMEKINPAFDELKILFSGNEEV